MRVLQTWRRQKCGENKDLNMKRESEKGAGGCLGFEEIGLGGQSYFRGTWECGILVSMNYRRLRIAWTELWESLEYF
jgi:hypothetical protein